MYYLIRSLLLTLGLSLSMSAAFSQQDQRRNIDFQAMEPFQVFDNLYFVSAGDS